MILRRMSVVTAALAFLASAASLSAQTCGQVVTGTLRLTADLNCSGPGPALRLTGSAPQLELAGFRIDMGGSGANAIEVSNGRQASITGPGTIAGAGIAVAVTRSLDVDIYGLDIQGSDAGVMAFDSARVAVTNNRFRKIRHRAVFIGSSPVGALPTPGAVVMSNLIETVGSGIELCGQGTVDARVRHNTLRRTSGWGIMIHDGASHATVHDNHIATTGYQPAIEVRSGSNNAIHDNSLEGNGLATGIAIGTLTGATCAVSPTATADRNLVLRNTVHGFARGAQVAFAGGGLARQNNLQGNLFVANAIDLVFERDSFATDARGNDQGARGAGGVTVSDSGTLNLQ